MGQHENGGNGNAFWRRLPGWGAGEQSGVGPGLQGPDYSQPRDPQPGEAPELLPGFGGSDSEKATAGRAQIRRGEQPAGDVMLPPYLDLNGPISYNQAGGFLNLVDLGSPPMGYRWLLRELATVSQTIIDDVNFTGIRVHFYIGQWRPGVLPQPNDWAWDLRSTAVTDFTLAATFTSDSLIVQRNQHLFAYLTNGGLQGYGYLVKARVKQIPDHAVRTVDVV